LENNFGLSHCHTGHLKQTVLGLSDLAFIKKIFPRLKSIAGHNLVAPLRLGLENPFLMTFLRNPISRVISHYGDMVCRAHDRRDFETCLREDEKLQNLQVKFIAGELNLQKAKAALEQFDFVGITERFDLSLLVLNHLSPRKLCLNYKRKRLASDRSMNEKLRSNIKAIELAKEVNALDLELYEFGINEIFPKLCENAGVTPLEKIPPLDTFQHQLQWKYVIGRWYNQFFRQLCKLRT